MLREEKLRAAEVKKRESEGRPEWMYRTSHLLRVQGLYHLKVGTQFGRHLWLLPEGMSNTNGARSTTYLPKYLTKPRLHSAGTYPGTSESARSAQICSEINPNSNSCPWCSSRFKVSQHIILRSGVGGDASWGVSKGFLLESMFVGRQPFARCLARLRRFLGTRAAVTKWEKSKGKRKI